MAIHTRNSVLTPLRKTFNDYLMDSVAALGEKSPLRDACEYALVNGGKRIRPLIVLVLADAVGHQLDVLPAAVSIEYLHTASLIVDDLPCMDNDDWRRGLPSVHKKCGEAVALLASYALISAGYEQIVQGVQTLCQNHIPYYHRSGEVYTMTFTQAAYSTGLSGATGGQFLDLFPGAGDLEKVYQIIHQKTVSIFETAFVFGWVFGGGPLEQIEKVTKAAGHFGMAFQIADDLSDIEQDGEMGTTLVRYLGEKKTKEILSEEIAQFTAIMEKMGLFHPGFQEILDEMTKNLAP